MSSIYGEFVQAVGNSGVETITGVYISGYPHKLDVGVSLDLLKEVTSSTLASEYFNRLQVQAPRFVATYKDDGLGFYDWVVEELYGTDSETICRPVSFKTSYRAHEYKGVRVPLKTSGYLKDEQEKERQVEVRESVKHKGLVDKLGSFKVLNGFDEFILLDEGDSMYIVCPPSFLSALTPSVFGSLSRPWLKDLCDSIPVKLFRGVTFTGYLGISETGITPFLDLCEVASYRDLVEQGLESGVLFLGVGISSSCAGSKEQGCQDALKLLDYFKEYAGSSES